MCSADDEWLAAQETLLKPEGNQVKVGKDGTMLFPAKFLLDERDEARDELAKVRDELAKARTELAELKEHYQNLNSGYNALSSSFAVVTKELSDTRAENDKLREVIAMPKWGGWHSLPCCPWCLRSGGSHAYDCDRQRALGLA